MNLSSKHVQNLYNTHIRYKEPTRSITFAVYQDKSLLSSHTLRYSPQFIKKTDMGLFSPAPTTGGLFVEKFGYYATNIQIKGHTGHKITKVGTKQIDGESMLKTIRELLNSAFGQGYTGDGKYKILVDGGTRKPYDREGIRVIMFDWTGESSSELLNEEFYEVFPNQNMIFDYERKAGRVLWDFTINLIGTRIDEQDLIDAVKDDKINQELAFEKQFYNTWSYLTSIKIGDRQAFTWFDAVNHYIAESYYRVAGTLYEIQNQVDLAQIQAQAYINLPYLTYSLFNDFVADAMDDMGMMPDTFATSPTKGNIDWSLLKESRDSFRSISKLISYPERFKEREDVERDYIVHSVGENDTLRQVAIKYQADWKEIIVRNNLKYPYIITNQKRLIIPVEKTSLENNTIRTNLEDNSITSENLSERIFGRDIMIDRDTGEWIFDAVNQDIATISGPPNAIQSIEGMEKTRQGEFDDYPEYGNPLLNYKGKKVKVADVAIMALQLKHAVAADPRVKFVEYVKISQYKGLSSIDQSFILINGVKELNFSVPLK